MSTEGGDQAGPAAELRAALEEAYAELDAGDRAELPDAIDYRSLAIGLRLGTQRPEHARRLLDSIEDAGAVPTVGRTRPPGPPDSAAAAGAVTPDDGPVGVPAGSDEPVSVPVASLLLARAATVPAEERATVGPDVIFGWAARLTSGEIVALGRVVDDMLAAGSPPDIARGFGIAWTAGARLPREELDALFREFPELEITVAGVLAGRDLRALPAAPRPSGPGAFFEAWVHRPRPEESQAAAEFEKRGELAQRGLVAVWNAWVAMRCRRLIPPSTFELLVHPWVTVVGPLPEP